MEDLERYSDDNDLEEDYDAGRRGVFGTFVKVLVFFCCFLVAGVIGFRIYLSEYTPPEMKNLVYTDSVKAHYLSTDGNLGAKTQNLRFSYDDEDRGTFFAEHLILIPEIDHLQITLRYNASTLPVLEQTYETEGLAQRDAKEFLSFRLTDNYERVYEGLVYEETGEMAMYRYFKLAFDGVDLDPEENPPEWIRLEIFFEGQEEPFSYILIYENNADYNKFTDYKLSKGEKYQ